MGVFISSGGGGTAAGTGGQVPQTCAGGAALGLGGLFLMNSICSMTVSGDGGGTAARLALFAFGTEGSALFRFRTTGSATPSSSSTSGRSCLFAKEALHTSLGSFFVVSAGFRGLRTTAFGAFSSKGSDSLYAFHAGPA